MNRPSGRGGLDISTEYHSNIQYADYIKMMAVRELQMKHRKSSVLICLNLILSLSLTTQFYSADADETHQPDNRRDAAFPAGHAPSSDPAIASVNDPLQPVNRVFFSFNDKLHFWLLKPAAEVYSKVLPQPARQGIKNFFQNLTTPVRTANAILQRDLDSAVTSGARFAVNTTGGVLGLMDPAKTKLNLPLQQRNFGQTLGKYHCPYGIYLIWPVLGPATVRSSLGMVGDSFVNPVSYLDGNVRSMTRPVNVVNDLSLKLGRYEQLKASASDPYAALRNKFVEKRENSLENSNDKN